MTRTYTATLKARGTDKRGQGGASATIVNTLTEHDGATTVDAETDFTITGRLASFGRGGMMQDISNRLLRDFSTCLQSRLADAPTAPTGAEVTRGEARPRRSPPPRRRGRWTPSRGRQRGRHDAGNDGRGHVRWSSASPSSRSA